MPLWWLTGQQLFLSESGLLIFLCLIDGYLIRYCSFGFVTLWSMLTLRAVVPSMHSTALVSPKLATWHVRFPPVFLTKTKQHVDPVSLAPTSFNCSSAFAHTLSKTSFKLFFSLAYSWLKSYFYWETYIWNDIGTILRDLSTSVTIENCEKTTAVLINFIFKYVFLR